MSIMTTLTFVTIMAAIDDSPGCNSWGGLKTPMQQ